MLSRTLRAERKELSALEGEYNRDNWKKVLFILLCLALVLLFAAIALSINGRGLNLLESCRYVIDHILGHSYVYQTADWYNDYFLWNIYLPRVVMAIVVGAGLAMCGVAMQSVMNNPLAEPYTTGISDGACFGAVAAIVTGFTFSSVAGSMGIVINAFIGGLVPAIIIIVLASIIKMSPATLILVGTALSYVFSGMETVIMVGTDADTLKEAYLWQIGTLGDIVSWGQCYIPLAVTLICGALLWVLSSKLNLLALGDDSAKSLGLDVRTFRAIVMIIASITVASLVSYVGIIGFIGLVAPHVVRLLIGGNNHYVIPASALVGSALILIADLIARTVSSEELRVGVVVSMIGAPIFLYIILSRKKSYGEVFRWRPPSRNWRSRAGTSTGARS